MANGYGIRVTDVHGGPTSVLGRVCLRKGFPALNEAVRGLARGFETMGLIDNPWGIQNAAL